MECDNQKRKTACTSQNCSLEHGQYFYREDRTIKDFQHHCCLHKNEFLEQNDLLRNDAWIWFSFIYYKNTSILKTCHVTNSHIWSLLITFVLSGPSKLIKLWISGLNPSAKHQDHLCNLGFFSSRAWSNSHSGQKWACNLNLFLSALSHLEYISVACTVKSFPTHILPVLKETPGPWIDFKLIKLPVWKTLVWW